MSLILFLFGACSYVASLILPLLGYCLACTARFGLSGVLDLSNQPQRFTWSLIGWSALIIGVLLGPVAYGAVYVSTWINHGDWFGGLVAFQVIALFITLSCGTDYKKEKQKEYKEFKMGNPEYDYLSKN